MMTYDYYSTCYICYGSQVPPSGLVFRYGRVDCPTAPNTTVTDPFPGADLNNTGGAET